MSYSITGDPFYTSSPSSSFLRFLIDSQSSEILPLLRYHQPLQMALPIHSHPPIDLASLLPLRLRRSLVEERVPESVLEESPDLLQKSLSHPLDQVGDRRFRPVCNASFSPIQSSIT